MDKEEQDKLNNRDSMFMYGCMYCTEHFHNLECKQRHEDTCKYNDKKGHPSYNMNSGDFDGISD